MYYFTRRRKGNNYDHNLDGDKLKSTKPVLFFSSSYEEDGFYFLWFSLANGTLANIICTEIPSCLYIEIFLVLMIFELTP
jgi:hypothetical protein